MDALGSSLKELLLEGRLVLREWPELKPGRQSAIEGVLRQAFDDYALQFAGPSLMWQQEIGLAAALFLTRAAWLLVDRRVPVEQWGEALQLPRAPCSADEHVSVDLLFRYFPGLLKRAHALDHSDRLVAIVTEALRRFPLSGVLADLPEAPTTSLGFAGHRGVQLVYAERLADHFRPAWTPPEADRAYVEMVWIERHRDVALLATPTRTQESA